jgi:DNA polymerase IV
VTDSAGPRRILHLDMDAFFASVELADDPSLKGKPVMVGGSTRGVVCAASYEAREYGVRSAMPTARARRLCPHGVFLPVRMARYMEVSGQVMDVLHRYSPLVEQASVDEAYLDISGTETLFGPPEELARQAKAEIRDTTSLACSIGIAPVKFLAKIASDLDKPDGLYILHEADVEAFLQVLPVREIPGVGARAVEKLETLGVRTAGDVLRRSEGFWIKQLGKWGKVLFDRARGVDERPVTPYQEPKSESAENTFARDTADREEIARRLLLQSERVARNLRRMGRFGRTVTLKLKFSDFRMITRSRTLPRSTQASQTIFETAVHLLEEADPKTGLRLVGVGVSQFTKGDDQPVLFQDEEVERRDNLDRAMDEVRDRFGNKAILRGRVFDFDP